MVTGFIMSILDSYKNVLKSTPIVDILAAFGKDDRFNRSGLFFSPFRDEKAPSFHWNRNANVWYDHGSGEGGDAIVLVQKLAGCSYSESLKILASLNPNVSFHLDVDETRPDRRAVGLSEGIDEADRRAGDIDAGRVEAPGSQVQWIDSTGQIQNPPRPTGDLEDAGIERIQQGCI